MRSGRWSKLCVLAVLSLQNVLHTLAMRLSRAEHRIKYSTLSVVILSEVAKFLISSFVLCRNGLLKRTIVNIYYDTHDFLKTCVPALLYVIQNNVLIFALTHLDVTVFQVTYQLKVLTTTIFSVILLRKEISSVQWISQIVLFVGVAMVQLQDHMGQASQFISHEQPSAVGLVAVIFASLLSGFAAVYFEKILKHSSKSLWARNLELSLASIVIAVLGQVVCGEGKVNEEGFFHGFDWLVWTSIALHSAGGLLVALVVKYADNILKGFACSASIVITCIISVALFGATLSLTFLVGTTCVVFAVFLYSAFPIPR